MSKSSPETPRAGIAIIGMAGRFPGAASVAAFWRNLTAGVEAIRFATAEELAAAGVDPRLSGHPDFVPASSTLEQPEYFDASFFGFSAREAEIIDPQQRVLLECAWEALEDAGYDPAAYPGAIGVFAGAGMNTYGVVNLFSNPEIIESVGPYQIMVGNDKDFLSTRIGYKLNLRGPAVGVQTACSTSLVAVQMAFESLERGECGMALAGGVSIPLPQSAGYLYTPGMIFSRDGHCRAFDAAASGTVPGAGAGIVVLKPLEAALADGDHIYAVIKGAAINNDGAAKAGYSAPSVEGQTAVIRRSMQMAGFAPETVGYVEAHGTGTEVGDPIEVTALAQAFQSPAARPGSCALGAVKTNVGHLDAAAGVAGLIKTALTLEHRTIPPTLHFSKANPLIDFSKMPFAVSSSLTRYEQPAPFRAGVSSFGIGGTNAHVSLEEPPRIASDAAVGSQLIVLSAKTAGALEAQAQRLASFIEENPLTNLADLAYTLQVGRRAFAHRRVLVAGGSAVELPAGLRQPASAAQQILRTASAPAEPASVAFLFPGQGSQYGNMGRDLYRTAPVFRSTVDLCAKTLEPHLGLDLRKILYPEPGEEAAAEPRLNQTALTQPALFVIEYAMAQLWMDCGLYPSAMIGHSVGEYVAACIAGVFSLEDALALIAARGRMVQSLPGGAMLAVQLSEQDLEPLLNADISIAAVNAPGQTVASGPETAIQALETVLAAKKIESRRLRTSHAFHSPMMDPIVESFIERVARVKLQAPRLRYLSNVTGTWITDRQATNPGYWGSHLRNAVRFADCGRTLLRDTNDVLLEVGPGDTLLSLLRRQMEKSSTRPLVASMRHALARQNDRDAWLTAAGRLWLANASLNWAGLYREERRVRIPLPTYPFERQRYWVEPKKLQTAAAAPEVSIGKKPEIADWFYVPSWKRSAREFLATSTMEPEDAWLVFVEDGELAEALEKRLAGRLIRVRSGSAFQEVSSGLYEIGPGRREDYIDLLDRLTANNLWPRRIVHAWLAQTGDSLELDEVLDRSIFSAMFLIQAIEERSSTRPVDLNIVADRGYSVLGEAVSTPAAGALNALGRVAALECPNITCRTIDLDLAADSGRALCLLTEELAANATNEIVAYRGSARWTHLYEPVRIEAAAQKSAPAVLLRPGGTYLITGGLGGVGLVLARHLARVARANIVLTARTPLPPAAEWPVLLASPETPASLRQRIEGVQSIEAAGGTVEVVAADSTDTAAMRQALATIRSRFGRLNGVIHAAGIAGAGMLQTKSQGQVRAVLAPKIQGTEWIREALPADDLDFILLCSSISATIPSFGLSDYAAANAYLDGFAAMYDDPAGTRVLSANWDTWQEVGMAVEMALPGSMAHLLEGRLQHAIRSAEAEEVFDRLLQAAAPQVLISTRDFAALEQWTAREVAAFRAGLQVAVTPSNAHGRPEALDDFVAAEDEIEQFIVNLWQELLGVEPIGIHDDFFKLGGHSLLGTQVLARLRERYRVDLSLRIIFEAATPADLAQHVRLLRWASNPVQASAALEREEIEI